MIGLARRALTADLVLMTKTPAKTAPNLKPRKSAAGKVLGTTSDGVRILKPKGNATHFTQKELREAVARVQSSKRTG
jgi:hypothetical protein